MPVKRQFKKSVLSQSVHLHFDLYHINKLLCSSVFLSMFAVPVSYAAEVELPPTAPTETPTAPPIESPPEELPVGIPNDPPPELPPDAPPEGPPATPVDLPPARDPRQPQE